MAEAREVMDRVTDAVVTGDLNSLGALYAVDARLTAPDVGEIKGREQIVDYFRQFVDAFSDLEFELVTAHEIGDVAIDEGFFKGRQTGEMRDAKGNAYPASGKRMKLRECDIAVVTHGVIASHRVYFDQVDFLSQLGLLPETS